jgi:hypothetical protein
MNLCAHVNGFPSLAVTYELDKVKSGTVIQLSHQNPLLSAEQPLSCVQPNSRIYSTRNSGTNARQFVAVRLY